MKSIPLLLSTIILGVSLVGCFETPISANSGEISISSISATQTVVPAGGTSLISCKVKNSSNKPIIFTWTATGAYGRLSPQDSICVFSSPSCHFGKAVVAVTLSDESGIIAKDSVIINP